MIDKDNCKDVLKKDYEYSNNINENGQYQLTISKLIKLVLSLF